MLRRLMIAAAEGLGWITTYFKSMTGYSHSWGGYTLRVRIPSDALQPCARVRLTFYSPTSSTGAEIIAASIGIQQVGSPSGLDFANAPTQLFFAGQAGATLPAGGRVVTDPVALQVNPGDAVVVSAYFGYGVIGITENVTGWSKGEKAGDSRQDVLATGYGTVVQNRVYLIEKIEVM